MKFLSKTPKKNLRGIVLLRLDFNTEGEWRMEAALPTIRFLLRVADKVIILSHRGRPAFVKTTSGKPKGFEKKLSLRRDAAQLQKFLKREVQFVDSLRIPEIRQKIHQAPPKSILLLENLRFFKGEEKNDVAFAKQLASLAQDFYPHTKRGSASLMRAFRHPRYGAGIYVNDAFAVSHRANASVVAITRFLPSYAGLEFEKEITHLSRVMSRPREPLVLILGGGKAHDKLGVLRYFRSRARKIILGGTAANTVIFLKGEDVGKSLVDKDKKDLRKLWEVVRYKNVLLPVDYRLSGRKILDIGPKSVGVFSREIALARTIVWSGPLGFIEKAAFSRGTLAVARAIARNRRAFSVAGGGETVSFLKKHKLDTKFSFISTGGGAMLDFLAGEKLPGIESLR